MKLQLKTLTGKFHNVEVDPEDTIAAVKQKIQAELNFPADQQNLVFVGKVLTDNVLVKDAGLVENSVVVIFIKKSKAPAPAPQKVEPPQDPIPQEQPQQPPTDPVPPSTNNPPQGGGNVPQQPAVDEEKLNSVIAMGFEKELATKALRASFGDVNVAVEYCMNGVPDVDAHGGGQYDDGLEDDEEDFGGGGAVPPEVQNVFNQLREHPQFAQLRALVNSAPNTLQVVAQQLSASNPQLGQAIQQYPNEFRAVMTGEQQQHQGGGGGQPGGGFGFGRGGGGGQPQGGFQPIGRGGGGGAGANLSAEDNEKVQQIIEMTQASRGSAIEAYIVCGKNVEQAINFLFDS